MVTKGDLVTGAAQFMTIWSVTTDLTPTETQIMLGILDDMALELESAGLLTGYATPTEYGQSDPGDDSNLADWMAGPFKKLLAVQSMSIFGRATTADLAGISSFAMKTLQHALVIVRPASNPATLPKGSGNEWAYRDNKFYSEQPETLDTETNGILNDIVIVTSTTDL